MDQAQSDVRPALTVNYAPYRMLADDRVLFGNGRLARAAEREFTNSDNVIFGKFRHRTGRTSLGIVYPTPTAFGVSICNIVGVSSQKQMVWVDARWCVAFVKDTKIASIRLVNGVRDAVRQQCAVIIRHYAITVRIARSAPKPATRFGARALRQKMALKRAERLNASKLFKAIATVFANAGVGFSHSVDTLASRLNKSILGACYD